MIVKNYLPNMCVWNAYNQGRCSLALFKMTFQGQKFSNKYRNLFGLLKKAPFFCCNTLCLETRSQRFCGPVELYVYIPKSNQKVCSFKACSVIVCSVFILLRN